MPRRRKGGSALMALARRRKLKAAKDKEGKMDAMVIKPAMSKLRTGAVSRRKKGSQTLMDLAKRRKKPAVKPASSQPSKFGARIPVESRSSKTAAQKNAANRANRAAKREALLREQKAARKESAGMRYGSEYKIPGLSKKDREGMEESVKFGAGGAGKIAAAGVGAGALKLYQMYKAKRAADLVKATAKAKRAATAAKKAKAAAKAAEEAGKGVSGIGATRAASARARTSGLGKPKPKPKKPKKKKLSAAAIKAASMRGGSQWR
tara:strand:- start:3729 stop:4520 length:792 start_codon:yes stop_codon:yes gene_type:complete